MRSLLSAIDRWLAPAPRPGRVDWLSGTTFAHRGLHGAEVPENSPAAFVAAIERGFGIECDVQRSREDAPLVFHDWELDRLTAESGGVRGRSDADLQAIQLGGTAETIPSLRALLGLIAGRVPVLIEIKSKRELPVANFCRCIAGVLAGYRGAHAVMSFDPRVGRWFGGHSPQTPRGLVVTEEHSRGLTGKVRRHLALWHAKPDFLAYDIRDLPSPFAAAQRRRGLPVASWTVRSPELWVRAAEHADAPIAEAAGIA